MALSVAEWWSVVAGCAIGSSALGQAFNIDCGGTVSTSPSALYGAGANQPGYWNTTFNGNLNDLAGTTTTATFFGSGTNVHAIPGASGDDKALMETTYDMFPSESVSIGGLAAGRYDLYAYSWAQLTNRTVGFRVFTGNTYFGSVTYGAAWPGGQVEGITYARISIEVIEGGNFFTLGIGGGNSKAPINVLAGIQLVPIPAPSAPLVMLGAALFAALRRRHG